MTSRLKNYDINIQERTCSCPDWRKTRSHYYKGEPQRLCKHLVKAIVDRGMEDEYGGIDGMIRRAAQKGHGFYFPSDPRDCDKDERHKFTPAGRARYIRDRLGGDLTLADEEIFGEAFGGVGYYFNFSVYISRLDDGPATIHEPPGGYYRWRMETLTRTGIAKRGADIPLAHLLTGLKMQELREIGRALGGIKFRTKVEGCQKIAEAAGDDFNMWPPELDLDDFFFIEPLTIEEIVEIGRRYLSEKKAKGIK